jgi:hypothetical protein
MDGKDTWVTPRPFSGAMSHIAGCLGSKVIVAINKDKEANIFNVAHFGIVGDYKEVLPALTAKLKGLKSTHSTPRSEARSMLRVDTERRFLPRFKNRGLAPSNVSK